VRALRGSIIGSDLLLLGLGSHMVALTILLSLHTSPRLALGPLVALLVISALVVSFVVAPHIAIAALIPLFAVIPAARVFVAPWAGAIKEVVISAAVVALLFVTLQRSAQRRRQPIDSWVLCGTVALLGLYVINLGGELKPENFDVAWMHGVRLVAEPLLLLLIGLGLNEPRRTMNWAVASLIVTAVGVACVGLAQQALGPFALVELGYEWDTHVRRIGDRLRSFGTLDDSFAYAALLLFGLAAVLLWMRRGPLALGAAGIISAGLVVSFVRSSVVIFVALLGLWLARKGQTLLAVLVLAASMTAAAAFLFSTTGATETRTVRAGPSLYLTLNGRTDIWGTILGKTSDLPLGQGVGVVGTAADRAQIEIGGSLASTEKTSVDSGYMSVVADVGLVGLAVLFVLFARVIGLARRATARGDDAGWLALGIVTVLLLDALTRESFTAFPTAFLSLLLIGVALAAAREESLVPPSGGEPRRLPV
jgi:hypothetical protein